MVLSAVNSMLRKRKGEGLTKSIEAYQRDSAYMKGRGRRFQARDAHRVITDLTSTRLKTISENCGRKVTSRNGWQRETNINL